MTSTRNVEYYHPSASDKARGTWAVVFEMLDEDGKPDLDSTAHLIPIFDARIHKIAGDCQCEPIERKDCWEHRTSQ